MSKRTPEAYIILTHIHSRSIEHPGKWEMRENVLFVDKIKHRDIVSATFVVEFFSKELVKSRHPEIGYDEIINRVATNYPDNFENFMKHVSKYKEDNDIV